MDTDGTTTASAQMTRIRRMKRVSSSSSSSLDRGSDGAALGGGVVTAKDAVAFASAASVRLTSTVQFASAVAPSAAASPVWKSNLQPDFNVSVFECFDTSTSTVLRELDESNRFVQKSAKSTSI